MIHAQPKTILLDHIHVLMQLFKVLLKSAGIFLPCFGNGVAFVALAVVFLNVFLKIAKISLKSCIMGNFDAWGVRHDFAGGLHRIF